MKKYIYFFLVALALSVASAQPVLAGTAADELFSRLKGAGMTATLVTEGQGTSEQRFAQTVGNIIGVFTGFLAVIALVIVIYAGFLWLTAGGNEEKVTKAKSLLKNGVIGFIILSLAYTITNFIIEQVISAAQAPAAEEKKQQGQ